MSAQKVRKIANNGI